MKNDSKRNNKKEIDRLPENLLSEVFDFIQFLESKGKNILTKKPLRIYPLQRFKKFGTTKRMQYMTTYNKGDIVLVPFPFSDQTATKKRPAVIISSDRV